MTTEQQLKEHRERARAHLEDELLPFWMQRSPDGGHGGFLTWFDSKGNPSGETWKTFLGQARLLFVFARAHREGIGEGRCGALATRASDFLLAHAWDEEHGGWHWILDREGRPLSEAKVGYGQAFALYAFAEQLRATGDPHALAAMEKTEGVIGRHMIDGLHGGYHELFARDWSPAPSGAGGGDRKSLDVHMHLMEAYTSVYLATRHPSHKRRLRDLVELILGRMIDQETGASYAQFSLDWVPLRAIEFDVEWGADVPPEDGQSYPVDWCSYGHDLELSWLLIRAARALGVNSGPWYTAARRLVDHALDHGLDRECGGLFTEGPRASAPLQHHKQFWSQAEALVGFLEAWNTFGDEQYLAAFISVHDFVHEHFRVSDAGGEWRLLVERDGTPIRSELGTGWKIAYHTVRSMIEVMRRLPE